MFASQGVVGRFATRLDVRPLNGNLPIQPGQDWFIFAPWSGIETEQTDGAMVFAAGLADARHAGDGRQRRVGVPLDPPPASA